MGRNILVITSAGGTLFDQEHLERFAEIKPDDWLPLDDLVDTLSEIEKSDRERSKRIGKGIFYAIRDQMSEIGVDSPMKALCSVADAYRMNNRGAGIGQVAITPTGDRTAKIVDQTRYPCGFCEGIYLGAVRSFGGKNIKLTKNECKFKGNDACIYGISWEE